MNYLNVQDYGATGDGVTDDTLALQSAFSAVNANGGVLYFPQGTYLIDEILNPLDDNVTWVGDGMGLSIIKLKNSANSHMIYHTNSGLNNVQWRDLTFDYNGDNQTDGATPDDRRAILLMHNDGIRNVKVTRCEFKNGRSAGMLVMHSHARTNRNISIRDCKFINNNKSSNFMCDASFIGGTTGYEAIGNFYDGCTDTCIAGDGNRNVSIIGNTCLNYKSQGIGQGADAAVNVDPYWITISGNTCIGSGSGAGTGIGIWSNNANQMHRVSLIGNTMHQNNRGVVINDATEVVLSGNVIGYCLGNTPINVMLQTTSFNTFRVVMNNNILTDNSSGYGFYFNKGNPSFSEITAIGNSLSNIGTAVGGSVPSGNNWYHTGNRGIDF